MRSGFSNFVLWVLVFWYSGVPAFQRFGVPAFGRSTFWYKPIECTSRERDESKPGIKTRLLFLKKKKKNTEESDLENFQDLVVALDAINIKFITIRR